MASTYLTPAGIAKLEKELAELKKQKRQLSQEVGVAREMGDLRENAEYHAAKERLQHLLERISEIEFKLSNVQVIDSSQLDSSMASVGMKLKVKELASGKEENYTLVGAEEADPANGKISFQSPLGRAFLGHKVNEEVTAILPAGSRTYRILSIELA
jgi:transcription elongation factor GreA